MEDHLTLEEGLGRNHHPVDRNRHPDRNYHYHRIQRNGPTISATNWMNSVYFYRNRILHRPIDLHRKKRL
jgi:hypothetical protein